MTLESQTVAAIDMGTNTFHLAIARWVGGEMQLLYKERVFVRLGKGGISNGCIADDAAKRALEALQSFKVTMQEYQVTAHAAIATSALRSASNGPALRQAMIDATGIVPQIIDGALEARLIYEGVRYTTAVPDNQPVMVMDIGGGSVEFIIGKGQEVLWKQSFEIGAQRLLDRFFDIDPLPAHRATALYVYLDEVLAPWKEALQQYEPRYFIGSAGTFETLWGLHKGQADAPFASGGMSYADFIAIHQQLMRNNLQQRLAMPGMLEKRVEMIVVASCLTAYTFLHVGLPALQIAGGALKEGVLLRLLHAQPIVDA